MHAKQRISKTCPVGAAIALVKFSMIYGRISPLPRRVFLD